ncbi:MAG: biotin--[acetyl-CoA-carboxylase] ligase [Propionibacteriaceae bacterium]
MPDIAPVDHDRLCSLASCELNWNVICLSETGSTNADLAELAAAGAPEGTVVIAEHQTAGRGRFARKWQEAPGAGVAMSVLLRPTRNPDAWGWLPLIAGLALYDALNSFDAGATLKWPNDILIESGSEPGKLCGILASLEMTESGPACVLGMGINIAHNREELPVNTATSLGLQGIIVDKTVLVAQALKALSQWYLRWTAGEDLREVYRERCGTIGRQVKVQLDAEQAQGTATVGTAIGVDEEGSLLVFTEGNVVPVSAGDAIHVRW